MATIDRARRPRRIAADEAHAWARNLRLNNPHAKLTLSMLSLYVDGDGFCFVSIPTLAEDTELSVQTVRNRLAWLEQIGAIARLPQWIDEYGRRNGEDRGKRTSDLIRLRMDIDQDTIEGLAGGENADVSREVSPIHGIGPNPVSPAPALRQPYDSAEGLISEPEPESPPKAPSGGESAVAQVSEESEPEDFAPAWATWRASLRRDLALAEFRQLPTEKQRLCRAAIPHFNAHLDKLGRRGVPNFHLWIRTRGFEEFPAAALPAAGVPRTSIDASSPEGKAVVALYAVARTSLFESRGCVVYPLEITPQVLAFADAGNSSSWPWIEDRQQIAAWSSFLGEHVHGRRGSLLTTRRVGDDDRPGFYAPWPWPPRKDGTLTKNSDDDATGEA